jgi:hypothetical protein
MIKNKKKPILHSILCNLLKLLLFIGLIVILFLEQFNRIGICINEFQVNGVLVLLPAIVTIISIVLSINKETICGVSRVDFNKLKSDFNFSFLSMILIVILSFAFYTYFSIFKLTISMITLDLIALFYATLFSVQEVPYLMYNKKRINQTISHKFKIYSKNYTNNVNDDSFVILKKVIQNVIFTNGIEYTYKVLKSNNTEEDYLFLKLFDFQNDFLKLLNNEIKSSKNPYRNSFFDISILDIIENGFQNYSYFLRKYDNEKNLDSLKIDNIVCKYTTSIIFINKITKFFEGEDCADSYGELIVYRLCECLFENSKSRDLSLAIITKMLVYSTLNNDVWFLNKARDENVFFHYNDKHPDYLIYFWLTFFCYVINVKLVNNKFAFKNINSFVNDSSLSYGSSSLKEQAHNNIGCFDGAELVELLVDFLHIYNVAGGDNFYESETTCEEYNLKNDLTSFDLDYLIDAWFEIFFYNVNSILDFSKFKMQFLKKISKDNQGKILSRIKKERIDIKNNSLQGDAKFKFLDFVGVNNPSMDSKVHKIISYCVDLQYEK